MLLAEGCVLKEVTGVAVVAPVGDTSADPEAATDGKGGIELDAVVVVEGRALALRL